jgi:hypothetical protein
MTIGKTIPMRLFNKVTAALSAENIEWTIWNPEVLLIENYNGSIDIECLERSHFDRFQTIVNSFV